MYTRFNTVIVFLTNIRNEINLFIIILLLFHILNRLSAYAFYIIITCVVFYIIVMTVFYGRDRFFQTLFAAFTVCLNFNVLPLFYVVLADEDFKSAIMRKDFRGALIIFLNCSK